MSRILVAGWKNVQHNINGDKDSISLQQWSSLVLLLMTMQTSSSTIPPLRYYGLWSGTRVRFVQLLGCLSSYSISLKLKYTVFLADISFQSGARASKLS